MGSLKTRNCNYPELTNEFEVKAFWKTARKVTTVSLMTENVLRRNNVDISILCWDDAISLAIANQYPEIVVLFLRGAQIRELELK